MATNSHTMESTKAALPKLSTTNYQKWFALVQARLLAKGGKDALTMTKLDYIRLYPNTDAADWNKLDGLAQQFLLEGTDDIDSTAILNFNNAKAQWTYLQAKYIDTRKVVASSKLKELTNYKKKEGLNIMETYAELFKLRAEIIVIKPEMKNAYSDDELMMRLMDSLPEDYSATVDTIKAREETNTTNVLRILKDKEDTLKDNESALWARRQTSNNNNNRSRQYPSRQKPNWRDKSESPPPARNRAPARPPKKAPTCFICEEEGHRVQECAAFLQIKDLIKTLRSTRKKKTNKKDKSYDAESASEGSVSEDDDSPDEEEIAHITREAASKIPAATWIADTGASSHMTDKIQLFSGSLKPMRRRTIKVGGGYLHADVMGTIILRSRRGVEVVINQVYYVPELGANLLSCRRLCMLGLKGRFDANILYLHSPTMDMMKATQSHGVYVMSWISSKLPAKCSSQKDIAYGACGLVGITEHADVEMKDTTTDTAPTQDITPMQDLEPEPQLDLQPEEKAKTSGKSEHSYVLMHRRFAHLGPNVISRLHQVTTHAQIPSPKQKHMCTPCCVGKMKRKINRVVAERKDELLELISIDVCGQLPVSLQGNVFFLEIVDNYSRKVWTVPVKDRKSVPGVLDTWKKVVELQTNKSIKAVRLDNAKELTSLLKKWTEKHGIRSQETEPYTSHQNGVAERSIQTTEESVRTMIEDSGLPIEFWDEAALANAYLRNRTARGPVIDGRITCPEEAYTGNIPSIDHIRVWGCVCYAYVSPDSLPPKTRHDKFMPRGRPAVLIGFDAETTKQYRVYAPDLGRCIKASTVKFDENRKGGDLDLKLKKMTPNTLPVRKPESRVENETQQLSLEENLPISRPQTKGGHQDQAGDTQITGKVNDGHADQKTDSAPLVPMSSSMTQPMTSPKPSPDRLVLPSGTPSIPVPSASQPAVPILPPWLPALKRKRDENLFDDDRISKHIRVLLAMKAIEIEEDDTDEQGSIPIPQTYDEAVNDPVYGLKWLEAIKRELGQLKANNTWRKETPPKDANIVTCKWVFGVKYNSDGSVERFKARLVARGFSQMYGIDYEETFAPTVRMDTMRTIMALIAIEDLETGQIDVNNAFTESSLAWIIYMHAPPGLDVEKGQYLRLLQSLYGLKQAAYDWYQTCDKELTKLGFYSSQSDPCLYLHSDRKLMVLVYVDDITIVSNSQEQIKWFKTRFAETFKIKDMGELTRILGMEIVRDRQNRTIQLKQSAYIKKLLKALDMEQDKHCKSKIPLNGYDFISPASDDEIRVDKTEYQRVIGMLIHLMVYSRPDISFALGKLSQYMSDPAVRHSHGVKGLLRYIRSTAELGITYKGGSEIQLIGYSDADYAADKSDRKSTMGQVFMLGGGPISWSSRKQKSVSTSTTEAEYMALSECSRQAVWLTGLLNELCYSKYVNGQISTKDIQQTQVELKGDNQGSISLVKNRQVSERSKHIDVAYHYVRDLQRNGKINVSYIGTNDMIADGLTKPLAHTKFDRFLQLLGMK